MQIAYLSPLPPQRSGIADYSRELLPPLSSMAEVTVFLSEQERNDALLPETVEVRGNGELAQRRHEFDHVLYHMGNSEYHDEIYELALQFPGVLILHDFYLHHSVARRTVGMGDQFAYAREMAYESGVDGLRQALNPYASPDPYDAPLCQRLIDASLGIIVHSRFVARLVRKREYAGPIAIVPALVEHHVGRSLRDVLDLPKDALLFGSFGLQTKEKQLAESLQAFQQLRCTIPRAYFLLVGDVLPEVQVDALIADYGLEGAVHAVGYVQELNEFVNWLNTVDVVLNLRNPTVGETSATALRAMAAARPLVVTDHGWYREIPPQAALKVPPGDGVALLEAMEKLALSPVLRRQMGQTGYAYVSAHCQPAKVAQTYVQKLMRLEWAIDQYA